VAEAVRAQGVETRVHMLGQREDVPTLLYGSDVMVFPSVREGWPGAVLEACAAGVPVVGSTLPGIEEISARCGLVECVSLEAPTGEWVERALAARQRARTLHEEEARGGWSAVAQLEGTPFCVRETAQSMDQVYARVLNNASLAGTVPPRRNNWR
jgi:glycosyltransferase involved in cell wall biosynthesis